MIAPICVLSSVPIATFGVLQIPLIVDLYRSTYGHIFGNQKTKNNKLKAYDIQFIFGKLNQHASWYDASRVQQLYIFYVILNTEI